MNVGEPLVNPNKAQIRYEAQFTFLQKFLINEPLISSVDVEEFLFGCEHLLEHAEATGAHERITTARLFMLNFAWDHRELEVVIKHSDLLIKDAGSTEVRAKGLFYRYQANNKLADTKKGRARKSYLESAKNDCGDLILALESLSNPSRDGQDLIDDIDGHWLAYHEIESELAKPTIFKKIGSLVLR